MYMGLIYVAGVILNIKIKGGSRVNRGDCGGH